MSKSLADAKPTSMIRAERILRSIKVGATCTAEPSIPASVFDAVTVETYANRREQGFALRVGNNMIVFAEERSGDDIVTYRGPASTFEPNTNIPSLDAWKRACLFADEREAAKYIAMVLRAFMAKKPLALEAESRQP